MSYGVTSVRPLFPLSTVTLVTYIYVEPVWEHLSDESKDHHIVSFNLRGILPKCSTHLNTLCKQICKECNIPIFSLCTCAALNEHVEHEKEDILRMFETKKELMLKDLQDLRNFIYPQYQDPSLKR